MNKRLAARLRLLTRIEALGAPVTRRIARHISDAGIAAVKSGHIHIPVEPITEQLVNLMLLAYVKRYRMQRNDLNLSFVQDVRKAAHGLDLNLDNLHRSFSAHTGPRVRDATNYYEERINAALGRISAEQLPTRQATIEMRRELSDMGLSPNNPSLPETLVRTHSQMAFGAAQWQLNQNDPHGLITGYVYSAVMDDRTRDEHAVLDGTVYAANSPALSAIWPPNGFNCRCQLIEQTDPIQGDEASGTAIAAATAGGFDFNPGELLD